MGFIKLPLIRGFSEIAPLWEIVQRHQSMICGGYARYCASQRRDPVIAKDVDIFPQLEDTYKNLIDEIKGLGFLVKHENDVSLTFDKLNEHANVFLTVIPSIQVIKPVIEGAIVTKGSMEEVLNNFDFSVVRVGILDSSTVLADEDFLEDDKHKKLRLKNIHCPISSLLRCIKYCKKGYYLSILESIKLFVDWQVRGEEYQLRIIDLFAKMKGEDGKEPTQEEINELEKLLRVD